ncbi:MAG: hypothetical protein HY822_20815, partial [Acidobacteria bacterium]|nr:hypothetical protein [Acidobacteriota bacterium]
RMFPRYPDIYYYTNGAGHQYHSLTAEMERHFRKGVSYQFSYVLARDIGDLERGENPEDAYNRARERSVWLDIPTHRVTGNFICELPFGKGKRFLSGANRVAAAIAGGWELSGVYSLYSGQFLTPTWSGPDPTGTRYTTSRTAPNVTLRPDHLRDANLPGGQRSVNRWFDPGAFAAPAAGRFGTSAKGVVKGPGSSVFNTGIAKNFSFGERARLRWEVTATNAFNHPNWSNPAMSITSLAQVGVISGTGEPSQLDASGARSLRTSFRIEW